VLSGGQPTTWIESRIERPCVARWIRRREPRPTDRKDSAGRDGALSVISFGRLRPKDETNSMPSPRLLILHNKPVLPPHHPDAASERDILETGRIVGKILGESGFSVSRLGVGNDLQALMNGLADYRPDAVFNLFEGLAHRPFTEMVVAGM